jgi:hypothetical protein
MIRELDQFYAKKEEPNKSCLVALRSIILQQDEAVSETRKYGMPCFCYKGKMFCYLWVDKKTDSPYILMVEGAHLEHDSLEAGTRKRMKILKVDATKDLEVELIESILKDALDLYRKGIIKIKK